MAAYRPETLFQTLLSRIEPWDNAIGRSAGRKLKRRYVPRALAEFEARAAQLGPGDVCLDLGANLGAFTWRLAATGAHVHAYEPDPETFARLAEAVGHLPNVTLHQQAVGAASGTVHLRRAIGYADDPGRWSQASSVVFRQDDRFAPGTIAVEQLAFRDLLAGLPHVALIKMDIEGSEREILADILGGDMPGNFDALFVETHEAQAPETLAEVRRLRRLAAQVDRPRIDLYWP
ncbi:MAG: FkbM family methyltransferase [Proteobacteria bacterium]|nr:FkbM family methyltransferase [Pseudomonadota bacterium]MBS0574536.1 FkbM family methyltransferase [Pseudomonadota bacterium]